MEIRRARPEEYDAVGELTAQAYLAGGHVVPGDSYLPSLLDAAGRADRAELWVAVEGAALLGTVTYCPHGSDWREIAVQDEGEFRTLAVRADAQRRGVGEALVRQCLERSVEDHDRGIVLSTLPTQRSAHRVYERVGFRRLPERDWSPIPGVDLWAFGLVHGEGSSS